MSFTDRFGSEEKNFIISRIDIDHIGRDRITIGVDTVLLDAGHVGVESGGKQMGK